MRILKRIIAILIPLLLIGGGVWGYLQRQAIFDWWQLRNYQAPTAIARLATHDTMTAKARHYFYVNHPNLISNKSKFQQACTQTEQTIVLGCYHGGQGGIDIYDVSDKRLDGVEEVTAAHEMLHAAYDRLSASERKQVDGWLQDYYQHDLNSKRIKDTINSYRKTDPKDVVNEMHSIFGSEVSKLPSKLEKYYKRYFTNRSRVVSYSEKYEAAFESREARIKDLADQLKALLAQINRQNRQLDNEKRELDRLRRHIKTQAEADSYNARARAYNANVASLNSLVDQYNVLRADYGRLVLQEQELFNSINTKSLKPASTE